ncbi:MAG: response regulator [Elusimicrobia bacterium]|nr:response regulator [Elusimicrobiota bacterium]
MAEIKKKILIVEDSRSITGVLKEVLEQEGYTVFVTHDGIDGIRIAKREKPDIVLLDLLLPKISGYEILDMIKKDNSTRHVPVLIISTLDTPESVEKSKLCGAKNFIKKPYNLDDLLAEIKNTLRQGS